MDVSWHPSLGGAVQHFGQKSQIWHQDLSLSSWCPDFWPDVIQSNNVVFTLFEGTIFINTIQNVLLVNF